MNGSDDTRAAIDAADPVPVRVIVYQGPTSIGLADFMSKAGTDALHNSFHCVTGSSYAAVREAFASGKVDIAVVPTALALSVYDADPSATQVISIASLGTPKVVTARKGLKQLELLAGTTLMLADSTSMEDHVLRYLLEKHGLTDQVTLQYMSDSSAIVAAISNDFEAIGILSEPYVTAARYKKGRLRPRMSLSEFWEEEVGPDTPIVSSVAIVRTAFAAEHPEAVEEFLKAQAASVAAYSEDPDATAQLLVDMGLVDSFEIAEDMLPMCGMTCLTGDEMHKALSAFLQTLYEFDPTWVTSSQLLPTDDYYYGVEAAETEETESESAETESAETESAETAPIEAEPAEAEPTEAEAMETEGAVVEGIEETV